MLEEWENMKDKAVLGFIKIHLTGQKDSFTLFDLAEYTKNLIDIWQEIKHRIFCLQIISDNQVHMLSTCSSTITYIILFSGCLESLNPCFWCAKYSCNLVLHTCTATILDFLENRIWCSYHKGNGFQPSTNWEISVWLFFFWNI